MRKDTFCRRGSQVKCLAPVKTWFDAFYEKARDLALIFVSSFNTFRGNIPL